MNLKPLGANKTELDYGNFKVLFSYETPVALIDTFDKGFRTVDFYSRTTSKHISTWFKENEIDFLTVTPIPQTELEAVIEQGAL